MLDLDLFQRIGAKLLSRAVALAPAVLAMVLVLAVGLVFAWAVAALLRRLAVRIGLDRSARDSGLEETLAGLGLRQPVSRLLSRVAFWVIFAAVALVALDTLGVDLSTLPTRTFIAYLPAVFAALLILVVGALLASFLGRAVDRGLDHMAVEHHRRVGQVVRFLIYAATTIVVVEQLGFDVSFLATTFTTLLTLVVAGLVFAFAWGGREVARNVLASHYLRENLRAGDRVAAAGYEGELSQIGSLHCRLTTRRGEVVLPNALLLESPVEILVPATDSHPPIDNEDRSRSDERNLRP